MTTPSDFRHASAEDILTEMERLLNTQRGSAKDDLPFIAFYQEELTRRSIRDILQSSRRLEKLTLALIILSIALLVFAIPPAADTITRWFQPSRTSATIPAIKQPPPRALPSGATSVRNGPPAASAKPAPANADADIDPLGLFSHEENTKRRQQQKAKQPQMEQKKH